MKIEVENPSICPVCGKPLGRTNLLYKGIELWLSCDCGPKNTAYFLNTKNLKMGGCLLTTESYKMADDDTATAETIWDDNPKGKKVDGALE